ncbi:hypothetical protein NX059_010358 [Plenodomus lindquistii]|nr:hypothetical protein NX059_010358 [Plenodomus lindquistii]
MDSTSYPLSNLKLHLYSSSSKNAVDHIYARCALCNSSWPIKQSSEMSPTAGTPRGSLRLPETAGYQQVTGANSQTQQRSPRSMSHSFQRNSVSSPSKQAMGSNSRSGSQTIRRSSRAASRQSSKASGGLVSLPGAGTFALLGQDVDYNIDPALLGDLPEFDETFFDEFMASDDFGSNGLDAAHNPDNQVEVTGARDTSSLEQVLQHGLQHHLGQDLVPVQSSQQDQPNQPYPVPADFDWDANLGLDPIVDFKTIYTNSYQPSTGLSALPGAAYYHPQPHTGYQQFTYPHSDDHGYPTHQPYYIPHRPVIEQTGYTPYCYPAPPPLQQAPYGYARSYPSRHSSREEAKATSQRKRKRDYSESSSEGEAPVVKRLRGDQPQVSPQEKSRARHSSRSDSSRRRSDVSDSSSLSRPIKMTPVRAGQKPKKHEDKTWVRINNTTKGETTRTARINAFADVGSKYKHHPLPVGNWESSSGFKFEYTNHYGMDEFKKQSMSARQIHEYITQYPGDHLRIWIQITPGDSARRYASEPHSRCIFEQCPNRKWGGKATIEVGSYRVAFDEKHKKYGKGTCDPFDCVGYAHLYCMERFLDFAGVCETADVKVDDRSGLRKEPKAIAPFTFLNNKHLYDKPLAEKFIKAAQAGALHRTPEFSEYPNHCDYTRGQPKPHSKTLVAALYDTNLRNRTRSQLKQFVNRKILPGVFTIHRGDQEMANIDKMVAALPTYQANVESGVHAASDFSRYYDQFFPLVNERIHECLDLRAQFKREDEAGTAPTRGGSKKRRIRAVSDSDDEPDYPQHNRNDSDSDDFEELTLTQPVRGSRFSPRKKQRISYNEDHLSSTHHDIFSQIPQLLPHYTTTTTTYPQPDPTKSLPPPPPPPQQQQPLSPTTLNTTLNSRTPSCTQFFRENSDVAPFDFATLHPISPGGTVSTPPGGGSVPEIPKDVAALIDLERRKSSTLSIGPVASIMKSGTGASVGGNGSPARSASFREQPVSKSREFGIDDPPRFVAGRRSERIRGKR